MPISIFIKLLCIRFYKKRIHKGFIIFIVKEMEGAMGSFDNYPKSMKKFVRYIKQDASKEQLIEIKKLLNSTIQKRIKALELDN